MEWISVKDRPPMYDVRVLLAKQYNYSNKNMVGVHIGIRYKTDKHGEHYLAEGCDIGSQHDLVTHWMPLPELPEATQ